MDQLNIPEGYQTVMPYIIMENAAAFFDFTQKVFGAKEKMKVMDDEGVRHAEIIIGGSTIMFASATDKWSAQNTGLYVHVMNADETYETALQNGAESIMPPSDMEYGRSSGVRDPFGNVWWITSEK
jgi:PhnB protein